MNKNSRGEIKLYKERMGGTMAYRAIVEHVVYNLGGTSVGAAHVPVGYFVIVDEFGRSKRVLSPESFHKIYELVEEELE